MLNPSSSSTVFVILGALAAVTFGYFYVTTNEFITSPEDDKKTKKVTAKSNVAKPSTPQKSDQATQIVSPKNQRCKDVESPKKLCSKKTKAAEKEDVILQQVSHEVAEQFVDELIQHAITNTQLTVPDDTEEYVKVELTQSTEDLRESAPSLSKAKKSTTQSPKPSPKTAPAKVVDSSKQITKKVELPTASSKSTVKAAETPVVSPKKTETPVASPKQSPKKASTPADVEKKTVTPKPSPKKAESPDASPKSSPKKAESSTASPRPPQSPVASHPKETNAASPKPIPNKSESPAVSPKQVGNYPKTSPSATSVASKKSPATSPKATEKENDFDAEVEATVAATEAKNDDAFGEKKPQRHHLVEVKRRKKRKTKIRSAVKSSNRLEYPKINVFAESFFLENTTYSSLSK
jgi:hypothetical protein